MMNVLVALVRREMQEHKKTVLLLPICVILIGTFFGLLTLIDLHFSHEGALERELIRGFDLPALGFTLHLPFHILTVLISLYYSAHCLFNEKQDRSLLFWQSLPTPEWMVIVSKLIMAWIVIPFAILLSMLVGEAISALFMSIGASIVEMQWIDLWHPARWFKEILHVFLKTGTSLLWLFPFIAWAMLCSVYSRSAPTIRFFMPLIFLIIVERFLLKVTHFNVTIAQHFWKSLSPGAHFHPQVTHSPYALPLGILLGVLCLYLATKLRGQYHDRI